MPPIPVIGGLASDGGLGIALEVEAALFIIVIAPDGGAIVLPMLGGGGVLDDGGFTGAVSFIFIGSGTIAASGAFIVAPGSVDGPPEPAMVLDRYFSTFCNWAAEKESSVDSTF